VPVNRKIWSHRKRKIAPNRFAMVAVNPLNFQHYLSVHRTENRRTPATEVSSAGAAAVQELPNLPSCDAYRLRLMTADTLSLIKRTVWLVPRTAMCITPEMPYSLL
jgi:hypothetical protein